MVVQFKDVLKKLQSLGSDLNELNHLKNKMPRQRSFSLTLDLYFDKQINELLKQKMILENLKIEEASEELKEELLFADQVTASRIYSKPSNLEAIKPATEQEIVLQKFLREMPKVEIHLHMEACISQAILMQLMQRNKIIYDPTEIEKLYNFKNLQEFVRLFLFILDAIKSPDDFNIIFQSLRQYLENNNICYAEVFLAPTHMIKNGLNLLEILQTIDRLADDCLRSGGPEIKYLIDVSRTFGVENAQRNLQGVLACKSNNIIGIGLGGAELLGPSKEFAQVFAQAKAEGLRCVAHAGEDDGPWSVRDTILELRAERIGHATSAIQEPSLLNIIKERKIPLEICLTSNVLTGKYVREERLHPVRHYYDEGLICTVNTDDPELFNIDLSTEYFKFYKYLGFTLTELIDLNRQGVYSTFHPKATSLWEEFHNKIYSLRQKYSI